MIEQRILGRTGFEVSEISLGASIKGPDVTQKTVDLCRGYIATGEVDALMVIYSIFRQKNTEMFDEAQHAGVGIVARTTQITA